MNPTFSPVVSTESMTRRRVSIEACIVASLASPNGSRFLTEFEIGKFVRDRFGFENTSPRVVSQIILRMLVRGRIDSHRPDDRIFPLYSLPADPEQSARVREERLLDFDRTILDRMELPKFFRIPGRDDLLPSTKTRTGYDVRTDYNRF